MGTNAATARRVKHSNREESKIDVVYLWVDGRIPFGRLNGSRRIAHGPPVMPVTSLPTATS